MSANISAKDISKEKSNSISLRESRAEKYRSLDSEREMVKEYTLLYLKFYRKLFFYRIIFFLAFLLLIGFSVYAYRFHYIWSTLEYYAILFSVITTLFSYVAGTSFGRLFKMSGDTEFDEEINSLEDVIVKTKLDKRFNENKALKEKIEDFYIELNNLTKAKYETAFRFYAYEFYIYTVLSSIIAAIFIFRIL